MRKTTQSILASLCVAVLVSALTGCPLPEQGNADVTVLISAEQGASEKSMSTALLDVLAGPVPVEDIKSFVVTVTRVAFERADGDEIEVFEGAIEVELMELDAISGVLTAAEVPAGGYTKIRLHIEDPALLRHSDASDSEPDTNIQTTADGRLFVSAPFTLPAGENRLVRLDFEDLHLVEQGHGGYVLTPQLRAEVLSQAEVVVVGVLVDLDPENNSFIMLAVDGTQTTVVYDASSTILLRAEEHDTLGSEADLIIGTELAVEGLLDTGESALFADTIILYPKDDEESES